MKTTPSMTHRIGLLLSGLLLATTMLWAQPVPPANVRHRLILIGDAGRFWNQKIPVIDAVRNRYSLNDPRTTLLYLGDNLYTRGLEDETSPDYKNQTEVLAYQAGVGVDSASAEKASRVIFIPGNHDWAQGQPEGWDNIRRQGRWLDSLNAPSVGLLPVGGCPGPEEILLSDNLLLVVLDSQWWLHRYDKPDETSDCDTKTEADVIERLLDITRRNKDKHIVLATHHPFRSYGIHGGYYTFRQHLFPLTDFSPTLYVPLPVIGSLYPLVRGVFGNVQDLSNPTYKHLVKRIEAAMADAPNVVFVAGHDHALQHIVDKNRHYIVSGAGINIERAKRGKKAKFVASDWGYVVLDELMTGQLKATFYTVDEAAIATEVYTSVLFAAPTTPISALPPQQQPGWPDSVRVAIAPGYDSVGRFHRWLFGNNYRADWATPVTLPVFDIDQTNGGFRVLKRGGGQQTKSLRLADATGNEWVLRSVQKDPAKALPVPLRATIAREVLQDQISAGQPFGALAVPVLAQAAGVPHAHPRLVYIPDDDALGPYRNDFGGTVGLLEEREPTGKSVSTPKVMAELEDDNDNSVDERAVLRARMLDLLIGDWDRHEDQWRWTYRKTEKGRVYSPVPRDRDQVFFRAEGLALAVTSASWIQPKFQKFDTKLANVNGWMNNARHVDRRFLAGLDRKSWMEVIYDLRQALTDSVLQRAVDQLPAVIRQRQGQRLVYTLQKRRGWLMQQGLKYFRFLSKAVDIPGSDKTELFQVGIPNEKTVEVSVYKIAKDGQQRQQLYHRVFESSVTNEIRLYGLKGDDRFELSGPASSPIRIRLIGGKGDDTFSVTDTREKPLIYDRTTEVNVLPERGRARLRLSPDKAVHTFDPHGFEYDKLAPLLTAGYNLDDGILLGIGARWTKQGFRKEPFAAMNSVAISRALATQAISIKYTGVFTHLIGRNDLLLDATIRAPDNVTNFFGTGNETVYEQNRNIRYYRTRYNLFSASALLRRQLGKRASASFGPVFQHFRLDADDNDGRFIEEFIATRPDAPTNQFPRRESFVGFRWNLVLNTQDNPLLPTKGVFWNTKVLNLWGFERAASHFTQFRSDLSFHLAFGTTQWLVLTNRLGGGLTYGNPAFYQLLTLGGQTDLRGFRRTRFAGNHLAYHNIEARLRLFDFRSVLFPATVGLLAFNDVGRVWQPGEVSRRWHDGYGGGLYITPASLLIVTASVGFSREGTQPYISLGYQF